MIKIFVVMFTLVGVMSYTLWLEAPATRNCIQSYTKLYTTRVTAANFRSVVNCEGKSLRKLAKRYGNICAVEQGTIPLYSKVHIPEIKKTYTVIDYIPRSSTNKHRRRADRRGIDLDTCIDRYKDVQKKQLYKYDLDITEIKIVK